MGDLVLHSQDNLLPSWLKENLRTTCQYCGSEMMNYYNNDSRCTNRRCSNPTCCGEMASKGDFIMKVLDIKGIGFARCLDAIRAGRLTNPVQLLGSFQVQPTVTMAQFLRIHCFEGVDSAWDTLCTSKRIYSIDDLFRADLGDYTPLIKKNEQMIRDNAKFVKFKGKPVQYVPRNQVKYLTVMITGPVNGYVSKEQFLDKVNAATLGRIVILYQKTVRKTEVDFLIRDNPQDTSRKVSAALEGGFPIVTSEQFIRILIAMINKINSEKSNMPDTNKIE